MSPSFSLLSTNSSLTVTPLPSIFPSNFKYRNKKKNSFQPEGILRNNRTFIQPNMINEIEKNLELLKTNISKQKEFR